jgi:hypothetical protein
MNEPLPLPHLTRVFPPTIVEQLSNTAAFADELAQLRELIARHKTLAFEILHITQRMALGMLSLNIGNRRPGRSWLNRLKVIIEDGRFKLTHQAGAFDANGILRDGQHRLLAVAETGIAIDMPFAFGVPPDAFPAMDVGIRRRGAQFLELDGVKNANIVQAFVRLRHRLATKGELLDDEGVYRVGMELNRSDFLQRSIAAGFRMQQLAPVSAASFAFWRITTESPHRERLAKFWDQLVEGYELDRGDPILEARRLLGRTKNAPKKVHQTMQQTQTVLWICWAWDQWIEGKMEDKPPRWTKVDEVPPLRRVAR